MDCIKSSVRKTILIADDEPQIRDMLAFLLTSKGYNVILAVDGKDALEKFLQNPDIVSLVVTDIAMPRMDGVASFQKMSKIRPAVKVLFMSGYPEQLPPKAKILLKPFSPVDFLKAVCQSLDN